jgi:hypothetical protein
MSEREELLEAALQRIVAWAGNYPVSRFAEPDYERAHAALKADGMALDNISAAIFRFVLGEAARIAQDALDGKPFVSDISPNQ